MGNDTRFDDGVEVPSEMARYARQTATWKQNFGITDGKGTTGTNKMLSQLLRAELPSGSPNAVSHVRNVWISLGTLV